jgi:hypothetical protein
MNEYCLFTADNTCDDLGQTLNSRLECVTHDRTKVCNFKCNPRTYSVTTKNTFAIMCSPNSKYQWKLGNESITSLPSCSSKYLLDSYGITVFMYMYNRLVIDIVD